MLCLHRNSSIIRHFLSLVIGVKWTELYQIWGKHEKYRRFISLFYISDKLL